MYSKTFSDLQMVELSQKDKVVSMDYPLTRALIMGHADCPQSGCEEFL